MAKETVELCDVCLEEGEKTVAKETCYLCGKSLCTKHFVWSRCDLVYARSGSTRTHAVSRKFYSMCDICSFACSDYIKNNPQKARDLLDLFLEPLKEQIKKEKE